MGTAYQPLPILRLLSPVDRRIGPSFNKNFLSCQIRGQQEQGTEFILRLYAKFILSPVDRRTNTSFNKNFQDCQIRGQNNFRITTSKKILSPLAVFLPLYSSPSVKGRLGGVMQGRQIKANAP
jgi:hypothetical protein